MDISCATKLFEENFTLPTIGNLCISQTSECVENFSHTQVNANDTLGNEEIISLFIKNSIFLISVLFGVPGNILILVLAAKSKQTASLQYIIFLAIFDLGILLISIELKVTGSGGQDLHNLPEDILNVLKAITNWLLALLALERCVAVRLPLQIRQLYSLRKIYIGIAVVTIVQILANFALFRHPKFKENEGMIVAMIIIQWVLPGATMLVCTILTILQLRKSQVKRRELMNSAKRVPVSQMESDFTNLTVLTCIFYFIFHLPALLIWPVFLALPSSPALSEPPVKNALYSTGKLCVDFCLINSAINLYAYLLAAQGYRKQAASLIKCKRPVHSSASNV